MFKKGNLLQIVIRSKNNEKKFEPTTVEIYTEFLYKNIFHRIVPNNIVKQVPLKFRDKKVFLNYNNLDLQITNLKMIMLNFYMVMDGKKDNNWKNVKIKKELMLKDFKNENKNWEKKLAKGSVFFVAEMSANHNGSLKKAKEIIKQAKLAGADAIKLQTYTADTITMNSNKKDFKLTHKSATPWKEYKNFYQLYKKASTPIKWHAELFSYAKKHNLEIFRHLLTLAAFFLENLGCVAYKIASPEITHIPLLERVAKTKKPVIISTGSVAKLTDIKLAIDVVKKKGNKKIILLKCDSSYPAEIKNSNLFGIKYLANKFKVPVGYSDHTVGSASAIASMMLGGCLIEKHVKLKNSKTPDLFQKHQHLLKIWLKISKI